MISRNKYMVYPDGKVHDISIKEICITEENVLLMMYYDYTESADMFTPLIKVDGKYLKNPDHKQFDEYTIIGNLELDRFIEQNLNFDIIGCHNLYKTESSPERPEPPRNNNTEEQKNSELDTQLQPETQPQPERPKPPTNIGNNKNNKMKNELELFVVIDGTSNLSETGFVVFEENKESKKPEYEYTRFTRKQKHNQLIYKALSRADMFETDDVYDMDFNTPKTSTHYVVHCVKCMDKEKFEETQKMVDNESMYVINPKECYKTPAVLSFGNGYLGEYPLRTANAIFKPSPKQNTNDPTKK